MDITTQFRAAIGTMFIALGSVVVRRFTGSDSAAVAPAAAAKEAPISPPNPNMQAKSWYQQYFDHSGVTGVSAEQVLVRFDWSLDPITILLVLFWFAVVVMVLYKTWKLSSQQKRLDAMITGRQETDKNFFVPLHNLAKEGHVDEKHALNRIVDADETPGVLSPSRVASFEDVYASSTHIQDKLIEVPMAGFRGSPVKARVIGVNRAPVGVPPERLEVVVQESENALFADDLALIQQRERVKAAAKSRLRWLLVMVVSPFGIIAFYIGKHTYAERVVLTRANLFTIMGNGITGVVEPVVSTASGLVFSFFIEEFIGTRTIIVLALEAVGSVLGLMGLYKVRGRLAGAAKVLFAKAAASADSNVNVNANVVPSAPPQRPPPPYQQSQRRPDSDAAATATATAATPKQTPGQCIDGAISSPSGDSASVSAWRAAAREEASVPAWAIASFRDRKAKQKASVMEAHWDSPK
jgi:hypothetical protein